MSSRTINKHQLSSFSRSPTCPCNKTADWLIVWYGSDHELFLSFSVCFLSHHSGTGSSCFHLPVQTNSRTGQVLFTTVVMHLLWWKQRLEPFWSVPSVCWEQAILRTVRGILFKLCTNSHSDSRNELTNFGRQRSRSESLSHHVGLACEWDWSHWQISLISRPWPWLWSGTLWVKYLKNALTEFSTILHKPTFGEFTYCELGVRLKGQVRL